MPYVIQSETVSDIADAIRYKGNLEGEIKVEDFAASIINLPTCADTQRAEAAADAAEESAKAAALSAESAAADAAFASTVKDIAESASGHAYAAKASADAAKASAATVANIEVDALTAEAWAVGTRNEEPVAETELQYNNNAKYYAELAETLVAQIPDDSQIIEFTEAEIQTLWDGGSLS